MSEQYKHIRASKLGPVVVEALKSRHFDAYYFDEIHEALEKIWQLTPKTDVVAWGGSLTFDDVGGLTKMAAQKGYMVIDRDAAKDAEERNRLQYEALGCGTFLTGANAISEDGQIVNIDGMGNRVAAMIYGPRQVIVIAGVNKIVKTVEDATARARNLAAPLNAQRFKNIKTPCALTGACADCKSLDSICTYIVTTRLSRPAGRIKVILIGKTLGF
ncbi:MAG: lactate utilization protein [Spirochaetaceae bacterium]|jgi:hypothetical protein|nr:lactate utilization protein [Spirochaetaceae bacterium]